MLDSTIRQAPPPEAPPAQPWSGFADPEAKPQPGSIVVEVDGDGGVTLREIEEDKPERNEGFDENLAEREELAAALPELAQEILDGVDSDLASRQAWIANYAKGLDLLGLMIETRSGTKAQKRNVSRVRDTTLLETVVKAQSQARGELLPADGPAKVETTPEATGEEQQLADDFETDFNQALVKGMPEYVPDLDRGLFGFFYSGNMFRYGYRCPLKNRPVVATISTEDLIVSEEATDLDTATRVTHRIPAMAPSEVKRRQFHGVWRECDLSGVMPETDPAKEKLAEIAGVRWQSLRPKDQPYTIFNTITDLDLSLWGLKEKGAPDGLPIPYRVTVEKYSRQILRIERYWKQGDKNFNRKRRIVHYAMVPGFGFLAYGFLHLQGNQVQALTAVVRLLIDALMFGNFPGGVKAKGARTETNEIEPGPGEWVELGVPAGMDDIRKVLMALPYKDVSPVAVQLYGLLQQAATRVGAAAMLEVGEGRANIPVGTIMAMLEEKAVVMSAIHKRMHSAMSQELSMIRELFCEDPQALAAVVPNPKRAWQEAAEFADLDLLPCSDPNVPSQVHRLMLATALATLLSMPAVAPMMDAEQTLTRVLRMIGISDADTLIHPPQPPPPDPGAAAAQATLQAKQMDLQAKQQDTQRKAASEMVQSQQKQRDDQQAAQNDALDRQSAEKIAMIKEQTERIKLDAEERRAQQDHAHAVAQTVLGQQNTDQDRALQQQNTAQDREERAQARTFGGNGL